MQTLYLVPGVLVAAVLVASPAYSQIPPESPGQVRPNVSFEVASVKADPARSRVEAGPPTLAMHPSGQFTALNVTVRQLILNAYDVRLYQIVGGPDWMGGQFFDIVAKAPDNFEMGQTKAMMRRLLEERFGLAVQRTMRAMPVYSLEWINNSRTPGPWLRRPGAVCDRPPAEPPEVLVGPLGGRRAPSSESRNESKPDPECRGFFGTTSVFAVRDPWFYARQIEVASILGALESFVGRPVIDKTGLTGVWDLDIKWDSGSPTSDARDGADIRFGSIFTAVREQLGLKLEQADSEVEVLVIERVQRPSPN